MAMSSRLIFGGGVLTGIGASIVGLEFISKLGKTDEEQAKEARGREILKYGAPQEAAQVSYYTNHALHYNQALKIPVWVAEHLTSHHLKGSANRRHSKFKPDPSIPEMFSAVNKDYWKSGWSRGHMAPAGDNKFNQDAMNETFYLSNILPQDLDNNGGFWNRFEMYCRQLTERFDSVRILSGPLMLPEESSDGKKYIKYQVIGKSEVAVPSHLYKVLVVENASSNPAMAAFIVPNKPISYDHQLKEYQVPLEKVESLLGYKIHPRLNRSGTENLCSIDDCQLMDYATFELYFIGRKLESAKTLQRLNKVWDEIKKKDLTPDSFVIDLYARKKKELESDEKPMA